MNQLNYLNSNKSVNLQETNYIPDLRTTIKQQNFYNQLQNIKNNQLIQNQKLSNNNLNNKSDKHYKYTYINIDSRYREKEAVYDYSNYYILPSDPIKISKSSFEIFIKCDKMILNEIKRSDFITLENIKPFHYYDFATNLIRLKEYRAELINLDDKFKFNSDSSDNYICCVYFDYDVIKQFNFNTDILNSDNEQLKFYKTIKFNDNMYYFELSNENLKIYQKVLNNNIRIHLEFYYIYNIPFYSLNAGLPLSNFNNNEYHIITKKNNEGLYFEINQESNLNYIIKEGYDPLDYYYFGGNNIRIKKIMSINEYYPLINEYKFNLNEVYNNVVNIKMVSSEFPCYINNITKTNNKLYFKSYLDDTIYSIQLNNGFYTDLLLIEAIETNIKNIKINNYSYKNCYFSANVILSEYLNKFEIELFKCRKTEFIKFNLVYYCYETTNINNNEIYENYQICNSTDDIKKYVDLYPEGKLIFTIDNFIEIDDKLNNQKIKFKSDSDYVCFLLFNEVFYINNKFLKNGFEVIKINNNKLFGSGFAYLFNQIMINANIFKNIDDVVKSSNNLKPEDKINSEINILIPVRFSLLFNYPDTFGELLGFSDVNKNIAITDYDFKITNETKYLNQKNKKYYSHINLTPNKYIFCVCDKFCNIKNNVLFNMTKQNNLLNDLNNNLNYDNSKQLLNTSKAFAKILIFKQNTNDNYIYNSFVNIEDGDYEKQDNIKFLRFYFFDLNGNLIDFSGLNHSFTIVIKQVLSN